MVLVAVCAAQGERNHVFVGMGGAHLHWWDLRHRRCTLTQIQLRLRICAIHVLKTPDLIHLKLLLGHIAVILPIGARIISELSDLALGFILRLSLVLLAPVRLVDAATMSPHSIRSIVAARYVFLN